MRKTYIVHSDNLEKARSIVEEEGGGPNSFVIELVNTNENAPITHYACDWTNPPQKIDDRLKSEASVKVYEGGKGKFSENIEAEGLKKKPKEAQ